jgi:hypothetical protein
MKRARTSGGPAKLPCGLLLRLGMFCLQGPWICQMPWRRIMSMVWWNRTPSQEKFI